MWTAWWLEAEEGLISLGFRKMGVWWWGLCQENELESRRGVELQRGGLQCPERARSTRHETCGEAALPGVSADWLLMPCGLGHPVPSLGPLSPKLQGSGRVPNILGCAVRPVSSAQDKAPALPHPGSPGTQASCPAGLPCL